MKRIKFFLIALFFAPLCAYAAPDDFTVAAQLLSAAKNADIQQVQILVNSGADINYIDATGLSLVCTALMNNDLRAAQILQMYGADASKCDQQIKNYKSKNKTEGGGGLFSGLSTAQGIALAAAGAAVVVGGLFLLTDVFDGGNDNDSGGGSTGDRPGGGESGGGGADGATLAFTIPDGPQTENYNTNLAMWNPGGAYGAYFNYFRPVGENNTVNYITDGLPASTQNYLLGMRGYSAFANGYMGQTIFRDSDRTPVAVLNNTDGGAPVGVAIISNNGINPVGSAARGDGIKYADSAAVNSNTYTVDKYFNFNDPANSVLGSEKTGFDLSGSGTAMNPFASAYDSAMGKIVGGWLAGGQATPDLFGFVPNGRLAIYRTGGGKEFVDVENPTEQQQVGTVTMAGQQLAAGDTIVLDGKTYTLSLAAGESVTNPTITINGKTFKVPAGSSLLVGNCTSESGCTDGDETIAVYYGTDGYYYVNTTGGNVPDAVYTISDNTLYTQKTLQDSDVKNFQAMQAAVTAGVSVIANTALNPNSRSSDYLTMSALSNLVASGATQNQSANLVFINQVNNAYEQGTGSEVTTQGAYANALYNSYGSASPIIVTSAGEFAFGTGTGKSSSVLDATFENYAPLIYGNNLEHLFMTIVAVQYSNGTANATDVNDTGTKLGALRLATWADNNGTPDNANDDTTYMSRKCGISGMGLNGIDPWCFSAIGGTAEMAVASAAGAVAAIKDAFSYMTNSQIFTLLALTADGAYLAYDNAGARFTNDTLAAYLKNLYTFPAEANANANSLTPEQYLATFKEYYGYGLINLERATSPEHKIYFYDGNSIVSGAGNAYWRAAANTVFRTSSVFNPRGGSISAPYYDVLESVDGELRLPRVWENEFTLGTQSRRGLYMGDVLGDLHTRAATPNRMTIGDFGFSMAMSEKPYADNLGGLDSMQIDYAYGNWNFNAGYQHYLTDGESRFNAMSNPIMGLASNAITSDSEYRMGRFAFGARMFSGAITDESLLENDPTIAAQYEPMRLGNMYGAQSYIAWDNDKFGFSAAVGNARETNTLLGAMTGGLLDLGNGNTVYVDSELRWSPIENVNLRMRSTFARTTSDASGQFILGLTPIESNAFALGVDVGGFGFTAAMPLAITSGAMKYAYADYDVVEVASGKYDLVVRDTHIEQLGLTPVARELRFTGTYRHKLGEFTDGAIGFIYRVNPNNTNEFGNESIFMMKLSHRVGI